MPGEEFKESPMEVNSQKDENNYELLFSNQKIQLDNTITGAQALNNVKTQTVQNGVSTNHLITTNATQHCNLVNTNVTHLSNAFNAMVVRQADLAADKQWNKETAESVAENLLIRGLPPQERGTPA